MKIQKPKFLTKAQRTKLKQQRKTQSNHAVDKKVLKDIKVGVQKVENLYEDEESDEIEQELAPIEIQGNDTLELTKHWSKKTISEMKERDWRIVREDYNITTTSNSKLKPLRSWEESNIDGRLVSQLQMIGFKQPTPIQRATIPLALEGDDLLALAETGSGKTLAFLLPLLTHILKLPQVEGFSSPHGLILAPTRELALQIEQELLKFKLNLNVVSIIGGHTYESNIKQLSKGCEVIVATPGRLIDSIKQGHVTLDRCFYLILDEADQMVNMGFEKQLNEILESLPDGRLNPFPINGMLKRLTLMFTATLPNSVKEIVDNYLKNSIKVTIGELNKAVESVNQKTIKCINDDKIRLRILLKEINSFPNQKIIVFVNFQNTCEIVQAFLDTHGISSVVLHGGRTQYQREDSINSIKSGKCNILIATDIAGRGIDINDVNLVFNYHMSKSIEEYTHRVGRTGRGGKRGDSITLWDPDTDREVLVGLKRLIEKSNSKVSLDLRNEVQLENIEN